MKTSTYSLVVFSIGAIVFGALIRIYQSKNRPEQRIDRQQSIATTVATLPVMSQSVAPMTVSEQPVMPNLFPAAIFLHRTYDFSQQGEFYGHGTLRFGEDGPELLTNERSLRNNGAVVPWILEVRLLNQTMLRKLFLAQVKTRGGGKYAAARTLIITLSEQPRPFYVPLLGFDTELRTGWGTPALNGKEVSKIRSIFSGHTHRIIGQAQESASGANFLIADYFPESTGGGEGFVDDDGHLWVLCAQPAPGQQLKMWEDYRAQTGKNIAKGIVLLTGPIIAGKDTPRMASNQ